MIKLYQVVTVHRVYCDKYQAVSLVNNWKGCEYDSSEFAEKEGQMHQKAMKYLFNKEVEVED